MDTGLRRYDECFNCSLKKSTAIKYPLMAKVNFYLLRYSYLIFHISYLKKNPPGGGFFLLCDIIPCWWKSRRRTYRPRPRRYSNGFLNPRCP